MHVEANPRVYSEIPFSASMTKSRLIGNSRSTRVWVATCMCSQDMKISSPEASNSTDSNVVERQIFASALHGLWVLNRPCSLVREANIAEIKLK